MIVTLDDVAIDEINMQFALFFRQIGMKQWEWQHETFKSPGVAWEHKAVLVAGALSGWGYGKNKRLAMERAFIRAIKQFPGGIMLWCITFSGMGDIQHDIAQYVQAPDIRAALDTFDAHIVTIMRSGVIVKSCALVTTGRVIGQAQL